MHALWLDATRRPHLTGSLTTWTNCAIVEASIWAAPSVDPEVEIDFHNSPGTDLHLITIGGPVTTIFPVNAGWFMRGQSPRAPTGHARMWSDLTISSITKHLTQRLVEGVRPNCEDAWRRRIQGSISWNDIWKSIGTELYDATEERQWRKLLHRAIFVRSKDSSAPTCACRLGCPDTESMLHLFECIHTRPLWTACLNFIEDIGCFCKPRFKVSDLPFPCCFP